ncbi:hypothetical protein BZZ01_10535 [Nostocales cyanobacterium HT-58-2]|nr:hypothetical protein BZZ01_10535 [Nostocales cyanobacterium HT-58-2]
MKVCIVGAGAIGGYMGAKLAHSGAQVTLIARGAHLQAIQEKGLILRHSYGAERLWTLIDEPIANQSFETLNDLEEVLFYRCQSLLQQQNLIQGLASFHWWINIGV